MLACLGTRSGRLVNYELLYNVLSIISMSLAWLQGCGGHNVRAGQQ